MVILSLSFFFPLSSSLISLTFQRRCAAALNRCFMCTAMMMHFATSMKPLSCVLVHVCVTLITTN